MILNKINNALHPRTKRQKVHGKGTYNGKTKGFSLVELVIVIAILAVLIAVLAPSLMTYTERSRAQKDVTTMDEVVNAVQLAMADQKCYDEMIKYSCNNNFITYSDSSGNYGQQVIDGEFWAPDGSGRATTITFNPTRKGNETFYVLETAIINDMTYGNGSVAENRVMQGAQTESNQCYFKNAALNSDMDSYTYNRVRQIVGDSTIATSATYANSSFTIFIRFNQKDGVTVADVNGAFNGTNLTANSSASKGSGTSTYDPDTGKANTTVTNPGKTNVNYTGSALGGTGSFSGGISNIQNDIEDYKQSDYVDNLQKENECYYYSTLKLAVDDVNNNQAGQNGDSDKDSATAFVYIENGQHYVVLLKDHETAETINITNDITIVIGGKTLSGYGRILSLIATDKTAVVDARIKGSKISSTPPSDDVTAICVYNNGNLTIKGGTYEAYANGQQARLCAIGSNGQSRSTTIIDAEIICKGTAKRIYGIQVGHNTIVDNCQLTLTNDKPSSATATKESMCNTFGLYSAQNGSANIINTTISAIGNDGRYFGDDGSDYWTGAAALYVVTPGNYVLRNCNLSASTSGIHAQASFNIDVYNSKIIGGRSAITSTAKSTITPNNFYLEDCDLKTDKNLRRSFLSASTQTVMLVNYSTMSMHNCSVTSNDIPTIYIQNDSSLKISQCRINNINFKIVNNGKLYLGSRNQLLESIVPNNSTIIETNESYKK